MANKKVFNTSAYAAPATTVVNEAGGRAYEMSDKQALAQIAVTNTFRGTYYTSAEDNLVLAKTISQKVDDSDFLAKVAIYSRDKGYMKDMPAFLCVVLASRIKPDTFKTKDGEKVRVRNREAQLFHYVFDKVIDNGKMLRNFIQIARSGVVGKKFNVSSGAIRKAVQRWFDKRSPEALFKASIGNDPSLRDILRMARPKANAAWKNAFFRREVGKDVEFEALPDVVKKYEHFKISKEGKVPDVDFRLLDSLGLSDEHWKEIARNAPWQMTRMNLNTFQRHNVFKDAEIVNIVANRLRNPEEVEKSRAFPYQLMNAYINSKNEVPTKIGSALQDAMELAIQNVPQFEGKIYVCIDRSGSMRSPVAGYNNFNYKGSSGQVQCVDVASLFASSVLRKNEDAVLLPFDTRVHQCLLNPRDTVITNSQILARFGGGGTDCSAPLCYLNAKKAKGDAIVFISDSESWVDSKYYHGATGLLYEWNVFKKTNPKAKLICIDLTPRSNSQVKEHKDILQIGGFSDTVFDVVASFIKQGSDVNHWVSTIDSIDVG